MKKSIHYIYITACFLLGMLSSCVDDETVPVGNITNANKPTLSEVVFVGKTASSITIEGEVTAYNGYPITERGIVWGTSSPLDISKDSRKSATDAGETIRLTAEDLKGSTEYYFCLYATNKAGTTLSNVFTTTTNTGLGVVRTFILDDQTRARSAKAGGVILSHGEGTISERGVYFYATSEGILKKDSVISTMKTDSFVCDLPNLLSSTMYDIQAYVKNEYGIFMGSIVKLTTGSGKPVLSDVITVIPKSNQATVTTEVLGIGDATALISKGFCWNKTGNSTLFDDSLAVAFVGDGIGTMTALLQPLNPQQQYYVFAYATNEYGTTYSLPKSFYTSSDLPTVITLGTPFISDSSVILAGEVINVGASNVGKVGVYYSTNSILGISDPKVEIVLSPPLSETSNFPYTFSTGNITGLKGATTYYYQAYASNDNGTSYGDVSSFQTPSIFTQETESFGGGTRVEGSSAYFVIGETGYLLGGDVGPDYINNLWSYNPTYNPRWGERNAYTAGKMKWMSSAVIETRVYVLGGLGAGSVEKDDFYVYRPVSNLWDNTLPTGPGPAYSRVGFSLNNNEVVYVGGMKDTAKNEVWAYNVSANTWSQKTDFPTKQYGGIAVTIDNNAYVGLGKNTAGVGNTQLWKSNGALTTWTPETPGSILSGNVLAGTVFNGKIYVIDKSSSNIYTIFEYDPVAKVWTRKSDLPYSWDIQFMFSIRNRIYIGFANNDKVVSYNPLWDN